MSRKTNNTNKTTDTTTDIQLDDSVIITDENTDNEVAAEQVEDAPVDKQAEAEQHDHFSNIVLSGKGKKLTPKQLIMFSSILQSMMMKVIYISGSVVMKAVGYILKNGST
ncbi:hypothetical protein ACPSKX_15820 [Moritella viscosa]